MPSLPSPVTSPAPAHHAGGRPSRANVAAKTFQCTECSAVLLSPTEFQLHIDRRHMNGNDSNNDEDDSIKWFWEHFDAEHYSIWRSDYKFNNELTMVFMSCNLVGGEKFSLNTKHY